MKCQKCLTAIPLKKKVKRSLALSPVVAKRLEEQAKAQQRSQSNLATEILAQALVLGKCNA